MPNQDDVYDTEDAMRHATRDTVYCPELISFSNKHQYRRSETVKEESRDSPGLRTGNTEHLRVVRCRDDKM